MSGAPVQQTSVARCALTFGGVLAAVWLYRRATRAQRPPKQWRAVATLKNIHLYPMKSGHLNKVSSVDCTPNAIRCTQTEFFDRSFLIVDDKSGDVKSAKTYPLMVLMKITIKDQNNVVFSAPKMNDLNINTSTKNLQRRLVNDLYTRKTFWAFDFGEEAAKWCSQYMHGKDTGARLVFYNRDGTSFCKRLCANLTKTYNEVVQFVSGKIIPNRGTAVMLNESSVKDLNKRLLETSETQVLVEAFRPNFIIEGAQPYVEDFWPWVKIGEVIFQNVKPNTRCMQTTIDPRTGIRNANTEPLRTLNTYRKVKDILHVEFEAEKPIMGMHMEVYEEGTVHLNDPVYIGA